MNSFNPQSLYPEPLNLEDNKVHTQSQPSPNNTQSSNGLFQGLNFESLFKMLSDGNTNNILQNILKSGLLGQNQSLDFLAKNLSNKQQTKEPPPTFEEM